jgi:hypothetical protein
MPHDRNRMRPRLPTVRWQALATGSLFGIAAWAFLYTLGAALAVSLLGVPNTAVGRTGFLALGAYGAVAASLALSVGSYTAALLGGVRAPVEALLYGASMWCLSTITLVVTAVFALCHGFDKIGPEGAVFVDVGLAAVGMQSWSEQAHVGIVFWSMVATLCLSFIFAQRGAARALRAVVEAPEA